MLQELEAIELCFKLVLWCGERLAILDLVWNWKPVELHTAHLSTLRRTVARAGPQGEVHYSDMLELPALPAAGPGHCAASEQALQADCGL